MSMIEELKERFVRGERPIYLTQDEFDRFAVEHGQKLKGVKSYKFFDTHLVLACSCTEGTIHTCKEYANS